jgi:hypothetical protein
MAGWVERSETHRRPIRDEKGDEFRYAQSILRAVYEFIRRSINRLIRSSITPAVMVWPLNNINNSLVA